MDPRIDPIPALRERVAALETRFGAHSNDTSVGGVMEVLATAIKDIGARFDALEAEVRELRALVTPSDPGSLGPAGSVPPIATLVDASQLTAATAETAHPESDADLRARVLAVAAGKADDETLGHVYLDNGAELDALAEKFGLKRAGT